MDINFDNLINLQKLDEEIKNISLILEKIPSEIEEIDKKIEENARILSQTKEKLNHNQKKRRELEAEIQDFKEKTLKYKRQLNEVKTNKEYSFLLKEIEEAQKKFDELEEQIISEMLFADDIEEEIKVISQNTNETKEKFSQKKDTLYKKKRETEEEKKKLSQKKDELTLKIPAYQINLYKKIFRGKNGIALSPVRDEFCSICHMRIRPQMLNELRTENNIHLCENCGRILHLPKKNN